MRTTDWTRQTFIKAWQSSKNVQEVALKLKVPYARRLSIYAASLRKLGITLKRFGPGPIDPSRCGHRFIAIPGKMNVYAIVQAAPDKVKREIYAFLREYFGD